MNRNRTGTNARAIVDDVLGPSATRDVWSSNYERVLPITVQDFELSAILPVIFYMFRFGSRRGQGKFLDVFGGNGKTAQERKRIATIDHVAAILSNSHFFEGFDDETTKAILGDMLLCFSLENRRRELGREEPVQRVTPAHYMSSWIDLPDKSSNLRFVPEMIVAMLADQEQEYVEPTQRGDKSWFGIGQGFEDNVMLQAFHQGIVRNDGLMGNRSADLFEETSEVGLDQLLTIRLAQHLESAPDKLRGKQEKISNQRPIAERATQYFSADLRRFIRTYASVVPRHTFVELLESCIAIGLTTIVTSVIEILSEWDRTGTITEKSAQEPIPLLVDCSNGVDRMLRSVAEQSMSDCERQIEQFPTIMMTLRLLDHEARNDRRIRNLDIAKTPYATEWVNMLGELFFETHPDSSPLMDRVDTKTFELAERLREERFIEQADLLEDDKSQPNPVLRLSEALTFLRGHKIGLKKITTLIDSAMMTDRPNGLATKRSVTRQSAGGGPRKRRNLRSLIFNDSVLEYLVHSHLIPAGNKARLKALSFKDFVKDIRERYGFYVDQSPPGMTVSNELLQANRAVLERRLRDLGLLTGVNDAESMKRLRARFEVREEA